MSGRVRMPMVDTTSTMSLILGWSAEAAGKRFLVVVPMQGRALDYRAGEAAHFAKFDDLKVYAPPGVECRLLATDLEPPGGAAAFEQAPPNAAADVRYSLQFVLSVPRGAPAAGGRLLTVYGETLATGEEVPSRWPPVEATPEPPVTLTSLGGSPIAVQVRELECCDYTVGLEAKTLTLPAVGVNYLLRFDFAQAGEFESTHYSVALAPNASGILIVEELGAKTASKGAVTIYARPGKPNGTPTPYGGREIVLLGSMRGPGWSGPDGPIAPTWTLEQV